MKPFPKTITETPQNHTDVLKVITRERANDITEFNNLPQIFMMGRKVGKVPTGSADVDASDRLGDFNYDASFLYLLVDNAGAAWRRVALSAW